MKTISNSAKIPILKSSDVLMSPARAILRFENILERDGMTRALKSNSFQKEREDWISGVFFLGYAQLMGQQYWLQENPIKHEDPDLYVYSYRDPKKEGEIGVVKEKIFLEVCEYPVYSKLDFVGHIKQKLKNKAYHPETWLLCYIERPGESFRLADFVNGFHGLRTSVREIWILYHVDGNVQSAFHIARVYLRGVKSEEVPVLYKGNYKELSKIPQAEFMQDQRGIDKTVTIRPGRKVIVPLPVDHTRK